MNANLSPAANHAPDDTLEFADRASHSTARAALWWTAAPDLDGLRTGAIGAFEATGAAAAIRLLGMAEERLRAAGVLLAVGPMDGSTWRRYRWVVESDMRGPFFLEPWNPPEYPLWWKAAGFTRLAGYSSSVVDPRCPPGAPAAVRQRFENSGFVIRQLDAARLEDELRIIHALSLRSFTGNFLYTPLNGEEFLADYAKVAPALDPEFVLFVERGGEPCAFLFGIPDLAALQRGENPALIAKTIAVLPEHRRHGIGAILLDKLQETALRKGYRELIHALQYERNPSLTITARLDHRVFRRYELLAKKL